YLLVYSIYDSDVKQNKLITGFPVEKSFVERTIKADTLGSDKPITTRYNGYIKDLSGVLNITGERKVVTANFLKY
ncbi:MAG: hypothetical protein H7263_04390, partial [Candidatus Sericytochromatia bacterium]|nr:hypothetical protein [Candidatus Sericytochromatia bacterium]